MQIFATVGRPLTDVYGNSVPASFMRVDMQMTV